MSINLKSFTFHLPFWLSLGFAAAQGPDLSSGSWLRVRITEDGLYKLTGSDLKNAGIQTAGKDASKLAVFTHQGKMMSETNVSALHGTNEIPVFIQGENDGSIDDNDYVLFYAEAPHKWSFNGATWSHKMNFYADYTYLYIGFKNSPAKRIQSKAAPNFLPDQLIEETEVLSFYEKDLENPNHMGRTWLGEKLGNETLGRTLSLKWSLFDPGKKDTALVRLAVAGGMIDASGSVNYSLNGVGGNINFIPVNTEYFEFEQQERVLKVPVTDGSLTAQFNLNRPNTKSAAWIDFIEVVSKMNIAYTGKPFLIRNGVLQQKRRFGIKINGSGIKIWNVSDPMNPVSLQTEMQSGLSSLLKLDSGDNKLAFLTFADQDASKPEILGIVNSPNLLADPSADLLIVTHGNFRPAAEKLAELRAKNQNYKVLVADVQHIFNQFSTSQQDVVAIRDYVRQLHRLSKNTAHPLKYVLLMGAASYDMKDRVPGNTNFVPTYELDMPNKAATFSLDDFYGYLDSASGNPEVGINKLTVSVGRIPCRTLNEALGMLKKLERYDSPQSLGDWRTNLAFVSDDVDLSYETIFTTESEKYARFIDTTHKHIYVHKLFCDAFKQVSTGNTEKYPDVNDAINRNISNGCLFMNYQGHGGPVGWAQEAILDLPMIRGWRNTWRMPVLFTATCEFSLYDDPREQSAGEIALLNPEGGPIALMSTTRLVFVSGNMAINNDFWTNYGFPQSNEDIPTLGDLFKKMKNRPSITSEDNKFALLGDPSMPLAFPKHNIVVDSINDRWASGFNDTLKAFSVVRMKGHIEERLKGKFSSFNGNLWVKVFDKAITRSTLVNDKVGSPIPYKDQSSAIYKGVVSVNQGEFEVVFAIPKDIAYNVDFGKISFYAHNGVTDAAGGLRLKIGGSETVFNPDNKGPEIQAYMNDTTFVNGGQIQSNSVLLARVSDINGLNATGSGIGRDMIAILDEGTEKEKFFILNEFFSYDLNSYTKGTIRMAVNNLSPGFHTLKLRVWDIYNNSGEATLEFTVGESLSVSNHFPFPNPFRDEFQISFTHNMPGSDVKATLIITDAMGRKLYQKESDLNNASATENRLSWSQGAGNLNIPAGMYFYTVNLFARNQKTSFSGRLIKY